jgi:tetratricopeptide (TPR) repeat protein
MRIPAFMAIVTWLGFWPLPPGFAAGAADALLVQAQGALEGGLYDSAQTLAASGLAETGIDAITTSRLLVARGLAFQALGKSNEALVDFTRALQGNTLGGEERARALFARGLTLDTQGRLALAIGDYTSALSFSPSAPYALNNRGNVHRRQGRFAEARRDYAAALHASTPTPQYPWFGLGQIAEAEGDMQSARDFYSRAVTADPDFALARERLGALGAPIEGPAGIPADTGIIVLKLPGQRPAMARVTVKQPPSDSPDEPLVQKSSAMPRAVRPISVLQAAPARRVQPVPAPGRGLPLRPAIAEGVSTTGPLVQLGAWRSEAEARDGWAMAQAGADGLLYGLVPIIVQAQIAGRGTFYRLRVAARGPAARFCAELEVKGQPCIPARD